MEQVLEGTRWSGADWGDQKRHILLVGVGGIGSFTAFSLSRIGHDLTLFDGDIVDTTNIKGGQMYMHNDVNKKKAEAILNVIRQFGGENNKIEVYPIMYKEGYGTQDITITGLDNMTARRIVFNEWVATRKKKLDNGENVSNMLFIDGRLTLEMLEIFALQGDNGDAIDAYEKEHLFSDEEAQELDCTTKQSTFGAMTIASLITSTLCNFLTNEKLQMSFRSVPFYQRFYLPSLRYEKRDIVKTENIAV